MADRVPANDQPHNLEQARTVRPVRNWPRLVANTFRVLVALGAMFVISGSLFVLWVYLFNPSDAEEFTVGLRPAQYYAAIDPEQRVYPDVVYANIFGVAHNSGDRIDATLEALVYGADVIEVDVVEIDGALYSSHTPPLPWLGKRWFRGPRLDRVATAAWRADALKLDLKESSPGFVALVAEFLNDQASRRPVIVASRDAHVLRSLQEQAPQAILLLSVSDAAAFASLQRDFSLQDTIDGITVRQTLIDTEMAAWLQARSLLVFAWTVNDIERVNELIQLGVDGITSDNLAILNLLGGQTRGERELPSPPP